MSYHPGTHSQSGSEIIMILVVVMSQENVIKGLCDFMGGGPLWEVTILPSLVAIRILVVEI